MHTAIPLALTLLMAPALVQPNEAEKLYRAFEKKIADAKEGFQLTFEIEFPGDGKNIVRGKGDLLIASGHCVRTAFNGSEYHDGNPRPFGVTILSDGKQVAVSYASEDENHVKPESVKSRATRAKAILPLSGIYDCLHELVVSSEWEPDALAGLAEKVSGFTLAGKEKVGGTEMQIIEYTLDSGSPDVSFKCRLWIDVKTNLPGKRHMEFARGGTTVFFLIEHTSNWQFDPHVKGDEFTLPK
jgi:hypothetical protein